MRREYVLVTDGEEPHTVERNLFRHWAFRPDSLRSLVGVNNLHATYKRGFSRSDGSILGPNADCCCAWCCWEICTYLTRPRWISFDLSNDDVAHLVLDLGLLFFLGHGGGVVWWCGCGGVGSGWGRDQLTPSPRLSPPDVLKPSGPCASLTSPPFPFGHIQQTCIPFYLLHAHHHTLLGRHSARRRRHRRLRA